MRFNDHPLSGEVLYGSHSGTKGTEGIYLQRHIIQICVTKDHKNTITATHNTCFVCMHFVILHNILYSIIYIGSNVYVITTIYASSLRRYNDVNVTSPSQTYILKYVVLPVHRSTGQNEKHSYYMRCGEI